MSDVRELVLSFVVAMVKGADVSLKGIIPITSWLSSSGQSKRSYGAWRLAHRCHDSRQHTG